MITLNVAVASRLEKSLATPDSFKPPIGPARRRGVVCNSQTAAQRDILDTMDNNGQIVNVKRTSFNDEAFLAE
jgi:hypothetical protein